MQPPGMVHKMTQGVSEQQQYAKYWTSQSTNHLTCVTENDQSVPTILVRWGFFFKDQQDISVRTASAVGSFQHQCCAGGLPGPPDGNQPLLKKFISPARSSPWQLWTSVGEKRVCWSRFHFSPSLSPPPETSRWAWKHVQIYFLCGLFKKKFKNKAFRWLVMHFLLVYPLKNFFKPGNGVIKRERREYFHD